MSHWNDAALVSLRDKLKSNVQLSTSLSDKLETPAGGFMSHGEAQMIMQLPNSREQINRVIETLRGKGDEDFQTFCVMLRECSYAVWADELEKEAECFKARGEKGIGANCNVALHVFWWPFDGPICTSDLTH